MPTYLVEVYLPRSRADEARVAGSLVQAAADQLSREGVPVRYVRTTFLPDDETCFHLIEAPTPAAAEEVSRRAALGPARIVTAIDASRPRVTAENNEPAQEALGGPSLRALANGATGCSASH